MRPGAVGEFRQGFYVPTEGWRIVELAFMSRLSPLRHGQFYLARSISLDNSANCFMENRHAGPPLGEVFSGHDLDHVLIGEFLDDQYDLLVRAKFLLQCDEPVMPIGNFHIFSTLSRNNVVPISGGPDALPQSINLASLNRVSIHVSERVWFDIPDLVGWHLVPPFGWCKPLRRLYVHFPAQSRLNSITGKISDILPPLIGEHGPVALPTPGVGGQLHIPVCVHR